MALFHNTYVPSSSSRAITGNRGHREEGSTYKAGGSLTEPTHQLSFHSKTNEPVYHPDAFPKALTSSNDLFRSYAASDTNGPRITSFTSFGNFQRNYTPNVGLYRSQFFDSGSKGEGDRVSAIRSRVNQGLTPLRGQDSFKLSHVITEAVTPYSFNRVPSYITDGYISNSGGSRDYVRARGRAKDRR